MIKSGGLIGFPAYEMFSLGCVSLKLEPGQPAPKIQRGRTFPSQFYSPPDSLIGHTGQMAMFACQMEHSTWRPSSPCFMNPNPPESMENQIEIMRRSKPTKDLWRCHLVREQRLKPGKFHFSIENPDVFPTLSGTLPTA